MQDHAEEEEIYLDGEFGNMYTREVESFADSILNGSELVVLASDGLHVHKVIDAEYKSSETKRMIDIED